MREIRAYIQPFALGRVVQSLMEIPGFPGMSVMDCDGFGRSLVEERQAFDPFVGKKRLEIIVEEAMVSEVVDVLLKRAHTGRRGDGRIFIFEVRESICIRTGEREGGVSR